MEHLIKERHCLSTWISYRNDTCILEYSRLSVVASCEFLNINHLKLNCKCSEKKGNVVYYNNNVANY